MKISAESNLIFSRLDWVTMGDLTKGFEDHKEELLAFRKQKEAEWEDNRQTARLEHIILSTWGEIERALESHDRYIGDFATRESIVMAELAMAQVRATLLQASQLKRIADALEFGKS